MLLTIQFTLPSNAVGETYKKVTSAPSDWSGTYIIVADGSNVVFTGQSESNNYGGYATVSISSNTVTGSYSTYEVLIEKSGDYYTIKHVNSSKYLGWTSGNNLYFSTSTPSTNAYKWSLSTSSILNANDSSRKLQYNSGSPRFACYTSSQVVAYLYRKVYTVTYDSNGGSGTMTDSNSPYASGATVTVLDNTFTAPDGKEFVEWNTKADGSGTPYNEGDTFTISENTTLYAVWATTSTDPVIDADNIMVKASELSGVIDYTITNPVEGGELTAAEKSDVDWITNVEVNSSTKKVTVTTTENTSVSERSATITLTYTYTSKSEVTKDVTVTQKPYYHVTYDANGGTGTTADDNDYDYNDNVTVLSNSFTRDGYAFSKWNTQNDGNGTNYDPSANFDITSNVTLYAIWVPEYTVTYDVNGRTNVIDPDVVVSGNSVTLPAASMAGYTHMGWSTTRNGSIINSTTYAPTASITLYAIFGASGNSSATLTYSDFPTKYPESATERTMQTIDFIIYNVANYSSKIQFKRNVGYMYNNEDIGRITSIVLTHDAGYALTVKAGTAANPTGGTVINANENSGTTRTYDFTGGQYTYFLITNGDATVTLNSIRINYSPTVQQDVYPVGTTTATANISLTAPTVISNGAILDMDEYSLSIGSGGSLTIEDGGQLICKNSVAATVKKNITAAPTAVSHDGYYTISTPVHKGSTNSIVISENPSITPAKYDMFSYNEGSRKWMNQKKDEDPNHPSAGFTEMNIGQGYLYRNNGTTLSIAGNTTKGQVDLMLACSGSGSLDGLNLIGNPYPHNIYRGSGAAIDASHLSTNFYYLANDGTWQTGDGSTPITPGMGIILQTDAVGGLPLEIADKANAPTSKDSASDEIAFTINGNNFEDMALAKFAKGVSLSKLDHPNEAAPMLYISHNNNCYGVANMSDDTKSFNLNFKAKTFGQYTLSYKARGEFSYLHVIDRMTGEDVDMLLDGEYSFIGAPTDNDNRFIVRLEYQPGNTANSDDIFAYQSGNDIIVNGEGELQIFDVTGRMVSKQNVNGIETVNVSGNGVYIFRLVGSEVKTQKIVVR